MRPAGVLLDVDGTLIDSNKAHAHAWFDALSEVGVSVEFAAVRRLIGMGGDKLLPAVADINPESEQGKAITKRRGELFQTHYLPSIHAFPAVKQLLERMKRAGFALAIASSAKNAELDSLLRIAEADKFINARTSSDDADNSKPDPDIVQAALARLGHPAERVILLGDTPYDVAAGSKAGVRVVALRCGGWTDDELQGACCIYNDPLDLLNNFDESPFGEM